MEIGLVKELGGGGRDGRVPLMPPEVAALTAAGHRVFVEQGAGGEVYVTDAAWQQAGAVVVATAVEAWQRDLVVKIKAPTEKEAALLRPGALVLTMLHAEQSPQNLAYILRAGARAIAMESVCNQYGERLFDCTEMSGSQAMLAAFHYIERIPEECRVLVMGYGRVATGAINMASRLGAHVKILRRTMHGDIAHHLKDVHILVNGLSWPKVMRDQQTYLVPRSMLGLMARPAMVVDVAVDEPGPIETCRATSMHEPVYWVDGVRHMCIYGYPALASVSSCERYSRQALPVILEIGASGGKGPFSAFLQNAMFGDGANLEST